MSRFPYAEEFSPIVQVGENIHLIGAGKSSLLDKYWVVKHIEPIQPFIVDFCSDDFYGNPIPAHGSSGYNTEFYKMDDEMAMPDWVLGQFRVVPLDDILIQVGHDAARNVLYDTKKTTTYISKGKPRHTVFERTTSTDTESKLWTVTNNSEAGRRVAKIVRIWLDNESASAGILRFGDGDGTGTDASADNADMSFEFGAKESIGWAEDEIPEVKFYTGVTWQVSVQPVRVTVTIEEDNLYPFKNQQGAEIFVWQNSVPYFRIINPIGVAQSSARVLLYGYKLLTELLEKKPSKYTDVPIAMMPRA